MQRRLRPFFISLNAPFQFISVKSAKYPKSVVNDFLFRSLGSPTAGQFIEAVLRVPVVLHHRIRKEVNYLVIRTFDPFVPANGFDHGLLVAHPEFAVEPGSGCFYWRQSS